jgi:hypothetical protein
MMKTFDRKLSEIREDPNSKAFILADAKDPDMSWGISSTGSRQNGTANALANKSITEFYEDIRILVRQAVLDIVLTSVSTMDVLGREERLFEDSPVTPAIRFNDTTDIWSPRGAHYNEYPSCPFASSNVKQAIYGTTFPKEGQKPHVTLGLYSLTFCNDLEADLRTLQAFKAFREEVEKAGARYFLEIFDPNVKECGLKDQEIGWFINDHILRNLAGVPKSSQPAFLKIVYHGPAALEELVNHGPGLVVGILGGSSGTTYDAFKLLAEAQKYGARAATFGRKIKNAEHPPTFVYFLREIVNGDVTPEEAVNAYHGELQRMGISPQRSLEDDLQITAPNLAYVK